MRTLIRLVRTLILLLVLALLAGAWWWLHGESLRQPALAGFSEDSSLKVGGLRRHYLLYVPPGVAANPPLLVVLHGSQGDGAQMRRISGYGFDRLAEREGFLAVYPDGFEGHWNDCRKTASYSARRRDIDDVAFLRALVARLGREYRIDSRRVFVVGYSNGGQMAFRLAAEAPDLPAAIAAVAASPPTARNDACQPASQPMAVLLMNGTRDPITPYAGGKVSLFGFGERGTLRSSLDSASAWAVLNGIAAPPFKTPLTRSEPTWTERQRWQEEGHPPVELLTVHGGGHVLAQPGYRFPRILGNADPGLDGPLEIWRFFSQLPPKDAAFESLATPPGATP